MRKILSILLAVLLLTTLVACGGGDEPSSSTPVSSESSTPESGAPETSEPETSKPETSEPDGSEPETSDTTEDGKTTTTTKKDDGKTTTTTKKDDGKTTTTAKKDDGKTTTTKKDDGKTTTKKPTTKPTTKTTTQKPIKDTVEKPMTSYQSNNYTDCIEYNTPLTNTYNKLTKDKALTVVYFGGSLSDGYGCSDKNKFSWRALSGQWLRDNFPQANIKTISSASGESGTYLGTYRVQKDVIALKPDLLFVEYAINDNYSGATRESAAMRFETIVREVRAALPYCDIVTVLTTDRHQMNLSQNLKLYQTAQGHADIAAEYYLPIVNIGAGLTRNLSKVEGASWWSKQAIWSKYFIEWGDAVHPIDAGHNQYFLCMKEYLENSLKGTDYAGLSSSKRSVPALVSDHLLDGNRQSIGGDALKSYLVEDKSTGVTYTSASFSSATSETPHVGYLDMAKGSTLTLAFEGTELALWHSLTGYQTRNIKMKFTVDGSAEQEIAVGQHAPTLLITDLQPGKHTITIKVTGAWKLGEILIRDQSKQTTK